MADSADMLGVAAQVAVTLAGFAGVVVVFGSGAVHETGRGVRHKAGQVQSLHA